MSVPLRSEDYLFDHSTAPGNYQPTEVSSPRRKRLSTVVNLPIDQGYPFWLRALVVGQRLSLAVVASTLAATLITYGFTVNVNRQLMLATAKLGVLQTQQKQLTAANAVFKNHLAQVAMTTLQGNTLNPRDVIFLETEEASSPPVSEPPTTSTPSSVAAPLGYPKGY
ncbi:MAG: hypothetical protein AAFX01_04740 [Cyanobacteria bacterium J06638_28]